MGFYRRIVVGTDGSDTAMRAVDRASGIAKDHDAALLIVTAYEPASQREVGAAATVLRGDVYQVAGSAPAEAMLHDAATRARSSGATKVETLAVEGTPVEVLDKTVTAAEADLLVVGNVGLTSLAGRLLGSVPQNLARRVAVDILIAHTS
jgi:nucleotide-binding universal stress UspA family protein